jgi:HSP20 family protein
MEATEMKVKDLIPWGSRKRDVAVRNDTSPVRALQVDINRAFEDFWRTFQLPMLDARADRAMRAGVPSVDVRDTGEAIEVVAELPGMEEADVDVRVADGALTVRGEKKFEREERDRRYLLRERSFGRVERVLPLPEGLDVYAAKAAFDNGVLTVTIPKTEETQAAVKRISVLQA